MAAAERGREQREGEEEATPPSAQAPPPSGQAPPPSAQATPPPPPLALARAGGGASANGVIALRKCCPTGTLELVQVLVQSRAPEGWSSARALLWGPSSPDPQHMAAPKGYIEVMRFLLQDGGGWGGQWRLHLRGGRPPRALVAADSEELQKEPEPEPHGGGKHRRLYVTPRPRVKERLRPLPPPPEEAPPPAAPPPPLPSMVKGAGPRGSSPRMEAPPSVQAPPPAARGPAPSRPRPPRDEPPRKGRTRLMRRRPTQAVTLSQLREAEHLIGCRGDGRAPEQPIREQQQEEGEEPPKDPAPTFDYWQPLQLLWAQHHWLRERLQEAELELSQWRLELERVTQRQERSMERPALLELERFERRALERKAAELEEELKALADLRADNERLKDENAALIRVISRLAK